MFRKLLFSASFLALATQAHAGIVVYSGADNDVSSLAQMTNSVAAEGAFAAAVPSASIITFETALPSSVTISGGSITNTTSTCGALCGFNTTPSGQNFLELMGNTSTISFADPIDAFGAYITGLQTDSVPQETVTFNDGSSETIDVPTSTGGGGAFVGFTDFGQDIASVTYDATFDIVALDDIRYASTSAAVPEPITISLFGAGLAGAVAMRRRRKKVLSA